MTKKQKKNLIRILISVLLIIGYVLAKDYSLIVALVLFAASYIVISYDILQRAWKGISRGRPFDENFLMAVASLGAIVIGLMTGDELTEGCAVMIFYQIGELFENIAVGKSRKNIGELIDIRPDYANVEMEDGNLQKVDPYTVEIGTVIVIKPGEKVPIDGIVVDGESSLDTAALTGESKLTAAHVGDTVFSGCINMNGVLKVRTTKEFENSTASKIMDLVENASSNKSHSEDFISKFARVYTPIVCYSALALAIIPPIIGLLVSGTPNWYSWIYRALTFLVISCPCALVISIPLSFFGGIGGASRAGILINGSNFMEPLARAKCVILDKTGTMTKGVFEVQGVHHCSVEDEKLIELAAHAECFSSHPISISLQKAYGKKIDPTRVHDVEETAGEGIIAKVDNYKLVVGNFKLMRRTGIRHIDCHSDGTVVHVAIDGIYSGHILIADSIKSTAEKAITDIKKLGINKVVMLTGDNRHTAKVIAAQLGIDEVLGELLPGDKVAAVERIISEKSSEKDSVIFVGDGINDAPVLTRADVGLAMGGIGSDAAIEAADVVIMDDDPIKIAKSIRIAKKCMRIVYENIWFSISVKVICLLLSAVGLASMWLAIFADTGVLIIAVLNAIRALNVKKL